MMNIIKKIYMKNKIKFYNYSKNKMKLLNKFNKK